MGKYFVYFRQEPGPRLHTPFGLNLIDPIRKLRREIVVRGLSHGSGEGNELVGLQYESRLEMDTIEAAGEVSTIDFAFMGSIVSFLTGISAAPISPYVIHTGDDNLTTHELIQFSPLPVPQWAVGELHLESVRRIIEKYTRIEDEGISRRISSSLEFYKKAISTNDPIERFLHLWIALEYLDYALSKGRDDLPDKVCSDCKSTLECPKCKRKAGPSVIAGLQAYFIDHHEDEMAARLDEAFDLRNRLFHREKDIMKGSRDAERMNISLRELYSRVIRHLLDIGDSVDIQTQFIHGIDSQLKITAKIELPKPGPLATDDLTIPHFVVKPEKIRETTREDGKRSAVFAGRLSLVDVSEGAIWKDTTLEMRTIGMKPTILEFGNPPMKDK